MSVTMAARPGKVTQRYQLDSAPGQLTPAERAVRGKAARAEVPRESHAVFDPPPNRPDPISLLEEQAQTRLPDLVPVRYGRMMVSPFTYYRGAALPMAADLAITPVSGLAVQACGDAHLSNFGVFGSAGAPPGLRRQRLRRDPARALGVGRQAAGRQPGGGRARQRVPGQAAAARSSPPRSRGYRQAMRMFAGMSEPGRLVRPRRHRGGAASSSSAAGARSSTSGSTRAWPRRAPGTACRRWPS